MNKVASQHHDNKPPHSHNILFFRESLWIIPPLIIAIITALIFLIVINDQNKAVIKVNFSNKIMLPQVRQASANLQPEESTLRVAVSGMLSPTKTLDYYQQFLAFIGQKLNRQVKLVLKPTYSEINELIGNQRIDLAFICSLAYVKGNEEFGMELLAAPQVKGETVYYSYLIVPNNSPARKLDDLRNSRFAFTDPLSNTGYLVPVYELYLHGDKPDTFFSKYVFTNSHNNSVVLVANKLVDGAAVDSLVYDYLGASRLQLARGTKVIARWGPYGMPPVVVSREMDRHLKGQLQNIFLTMHESNDGREILAALNIDKFIIIPNDRYESIRQMLMALGWQ